jgi:hypothetical protein
MVTAVAHHLVRPSRVALVLLFAGGAVAGCGDDLPFSRNHTASDATKLAVPSTLTPPVQVVDIDGAPRGWHMREKVAEALRQRDIPAGTANQGKAGYVLRGEVRETDRTKRSAQVNVVWKLYDAKGKKVGEVTQVAAVPRGAMRKANDDVLEAIADAAAESISPIVPSTRLDVADNVTTGEPDDKAKRKVPKKKVTALGKQKPTNTGIARNFEARVKDAERDKDGKIKLPKPLHPRTADARKSPTAIGRIDDGTSALARNLARGLNPAAGDETKRKRGRSPDARPPELADPNRRGPKITFRERPKPATLNRDAPKQVAAAPKVQTEPTPNRPHRVVTEFYPAAPKAKRRAAAPAPTKRVTIARATTAKKAETKKAETKKGAPKKVAAIAPATRSTTVKIPPAARTAPKPTAKAAPKATPKPAGAAPARASGKYVFWVQVGSYRTAALSAAKWTQTRDRAPALLGNVAHRIKRARVGDRGIWHRIQVGPYATKGLALRKCRRLKAAQVDCFILPEHPGPGIHPISQAPTYAPRVTVVTNDTGRAPATRKPAARRSFRRAHRAGRRTRFPLTTAPGIPGVIP